MEEKKKKFIIPKADLLDFAKEDIITMSGEDTLWWGEEENTEEF